MIVFYNSNKVYKTAYYLGVPQSCNLASRSQLWVGPFVPAFFNWAKKNRPIKKELHVSPSRNQPEHKEAIIIVQIQQFTN